MFGQHKFLVGVVAQQRTVNARLEALAARLAAKVADARFLVDLH